MCRRSYVICLLLLIIAAPALAGSVLELETKEFRGGQPIVGTVQITTEGSDTRIEIISVSSSEAGGLIFHSDRNEMVILDHAQSNYMVIDQARMDAMATQMSDAMEEMRQQLDAMPPEQRAMAEQMMQGRLPQQSAQEAPLSIQDLGSTGEVAGIKCRNHSVLRGGKKIREICVGNWNDIEGGAETAVALQGVAEFFEGMRKAFSGTGSMEVFDRQQELFGHMRELDGYPILYRDFNATGGLERESILKSARQESKDAAFFQPPRGYTLQALP